jgi:Rrf2 family protein
MISQSAEYALRAVACIAAEDGRPLTSRQIAAAAKVPLGYLSKILGRLVRGGIITSQRGLNGGFVLARNPEALTLLHLVQLVDGSRRVAACPLGIPAYAGRLCPLHRQVDRAAELAEQTLAGVTVANVLAQSRIEYGEPCSQVDAAQIAFCNSNSQPKTTFSSGNESQGN